MIATGIQRKLGSIDQIFWNFLLRGAGLFDKTEMPQKPESLAGITQDAWELLYCISIFKFQPEKVTTAHVASADISKDNSEAPLGNAEESKDGEEQQIK